MDESTSMPPLVDRRWLDKRKNLYTFVFAFHMCQYVVITSVMSFGGLYLKYLKERYIPFSVEAMLGAMLITGCFSAFIFGRMNDLTGSFKEITIATLVVMITCTILYIIGPESNVVPLAYGLFGLSEGVAVVLRSELCRAYGQSTTIVQVSVRFGSVLGTALGCLLIIAGIFTKIDVGPWHLSGANFGVIVASAELAVLLISSFCAVSNLSNEYNLKYETVEKEYRAQLEKDTAESCFLTDIESSREESYFTNSNAELKTISKSSLTMELSFLFRCLPTFKLLCLSFLHGCISMSFERFLPLIGEENLAWQGMRLTLAYLFSCIPPVIAVIFFSVKGRNVSDYHLLVGGYWFIAVCGLTSGVLGIFLHKELYGYVLFSFILSAHKLSWSFLDAVTASLFSKLIPSQSQCLAEATRYFVTSCGMCIGAFLTAIGYRDLILYSSILLLVCCLTFFLLWTERETYKKTKLLWIFNAPASSSDKGL